jgi:hypothetical protein
MDLHIEYTCESFETKKTNFETHKAESIKVEAVNNVKFKKVIPNIEKQKPMNFLNRKVKNSRIDDYIEANENVNTLNESDFDADLEKIFEMIKNDK